MVALTRKVAAQAGQSTIRTDRLQRVSALLAQLNQKAGQGAAQQVYALADIGEEVRLLENGREVASWKPDDPNIERHVVALIGA